MVDLKQKDVRRLVLEAAARRLSTFAAGELLFRGSLVTGIWVGRQRRHAQDLDFLARFPFAEDRVVRIMKDGLSQDVGDDADFDVTAMNSNRIFADSPFPGVRLQVPATVSPRQDALQIDVSFGDPLPCDPVATSLQTEHDTFEIPAPRPEVGFAWKLHGLVEFDGLSWRAKDLADLWLIQRHCDFDEAVLREAIRMAFESRDGPLWRLDRLAKAQMGRSPRSRREWMSFRQSNPEAQLPADVREAVRSVAARINRHWSGLREDSSLFAINPTRDEVLSAVADRREFRVHEWEDGGVTVVYEHVGRDTFPLPEYAATHREFRRRQLLREARGITFGKDGKLLARPFPRFEQLDESKPIGGSLMLEKLDGSLVFPTPHTDSYVWRTRRGRSEIADQAARFAAGSEADYDGLIRQCIELGRTPLFEWCSRERVIVLDHPHPRLALTAIRDNVSGEFISWEELGALAQAHRVELVNCLGRLTDPETQLAEVRSWKDCEGCVLVKDGRLQKLKSEHYRLLHRTVEGPRRDAARWQLIASGHAEQLCAVSQSRGIPLVGYVKEFETAINTLVQQITVDLKRFSEDRKRLATRTENWPAMKRRLYFRTFGATDIAGKIREFILENCESKASFEQMATLMNGPQLRDG